MEVFSEFCIKMAEAERDASHNTCNNVTEPANAVADYETKIPEMSGWLMKRSKISHKWKKQWFHLKGTDMFYGDTNEVNKNLPVFTLKCNKPTEVRVGAGVDG